MQGFQPPPPPGFPGFPQPPMTHPGYAPPPVQAAPQYAAPPGAFPGAPQYAAPPANPAPLGYAPPPAYGAPPGGAFTPPGAPAPGYGAPPVAAGGRFAGMNGSQLWEGGTYFDGPGEFECTISRVLLKETRKSGVALIVELTIDASSDPAKHPVGAKRGWVQPLAKRDTAFPNLLGFIAAAYGYNADIAEHAAAISTQISPQSEALLEAAVGGNLNDRKIHVSTRFHTTKGDAGRAPIQITLTAFRPARVAG